MLKVKRLKCLLSLTFLFNTYTLSIVTPFNALATDVVNDKDMEIIHKDEMALDKNSIKMQYEKFEQKELLKKMNEKTDEPEWKEFILTFYTSLESENSSAGAVTCQNKPLSPGGVANNVIPLNTKLYLEDYGQVIVNDKGSDKYFGVDNRLDVFIKREPGESDKQYSQRVNGYGVQKVQGYIVK
ncbi:MAG TPA: 3D domain-containing protein [Clostridium sp.]